MTGENMKIYVYDLSKPKTYPYQKLQQVQTTILNSDQTQSLSRLAKYQHYKYHRLISELAYHEYLLIANHFLVSLHALNPFLLDNLITHTKVEALPKDFQNRPKEVQTPQPKQTIQSKPKADLQTVSGYIVCGILSQKDYFITKVSSKDYDQRIKTYQQKLPSWTHTDQTLTKVTRKIGMDQKIPVKVITDYIKQLLNNDQNTVVRWGNRKLRKEVFDSQPELKKILSNNQRKSSKS